MNKQIVYVLTRTCDGDVAVDGVYTTQKKAEKYRDELMESFGVSKEDWEKGNSEYDWEIHRREVL